ncbi:uncharacterized protein Dmoj_GI18717, isoform B [Drosophila mojavensis]|uniref:Uncharacterized protein, isoform B n=1 Tax=Drosophila mojavensis TaxID=7230 RepID=A0A0Q9X9C7_DROMO|nr:uncharacterized protein Dmoj_GI18717, isoform B [Drosophila mojavensis]
MGCNTSQELKTKDGGAIDAVSNGEPEPSAPQMELDDGGNSCSVKSSNNHTNHAKSNSIISNGDAKAAAVAAITKGASAATNGVDRSCDKAEITEFNDDVEEEDEEPEVEILIPHHHHHHGSKKIRRNPLKNLDLDFKFDVNSF